MNRACLLLLITLIQSQSDGILLPNPDDASESFEDGFEDFRLEDWADKAPFPVNVISDKNQLSESSGKRSTSDAFTRRSALDKNFMRFGRASPRHFCEHLRTGASDGKPSFFRFGRGLKENFIRFGRGGKDSFIRFGRARPEDFFRAGKSMRDNFIRFGKADRNFMRFGRAKAEDGEQELPSSDYPESNFGSHGKYSRVPDDLLRFVKSGSQKDVRNGTNFLRFGKKEPEEVYADNESAPGARKRRAAENGRKEGERRVEVSGGQGNRAESAKVLKRSTGYFEELPGNFPRRLSPLFVTSSWQSLENLRNSRLTPFFPLTPDIPISSFFSRGSDAKRNQGGGSNFIRFG